MRRDSRPETSHPLLERVLFQAQQHAIVALDGEGRVVEWSEGAARIFGYDAGEMAGRTLECLMEPGEAERGGADQALSVARAHGHAEEDRWHVRKDGARIWVCSVTSLLRDEGGGIAGFVQIARDRTDLRRQVESLQHRLAEADGAERRRHVVLGTLAHELRNPMGEIANAARLVRLIASGDERVSIAARGIERHVRFIDDLVRDLLESTRLAVGKARLHCETVELHKLLCDAAETTQGAVDARGQRLEVAATAGAQVEVDVVRMRQIVGNLVGNASKFSPPGSPIRVEAKVEAGELVLRVEDRGRGIAAEMLPRVFDLFTQTGIEGQRAGHGLGLGLAVVKSLVEMHGGRVQACSGGDGRGTEIVVRMPARRPGAESPSP